MSKGSHNLSGSFDKSFADMDYEVPGDDLDELIFHTRRRLNIMGDWRYPFPKLGRVKFPCWPGGDCACGGCIGECYMNNGCPDGAPCRPCYNQWQPKELDLGRVSPDA